MKFVGPNTALTCVGRAGTAGLAVLLGAAALSSLPALPAPSSANGGGRSSCSRRSRPVAVVLLCTRWCLPKTHRV